MGQASMLKVLPLISIYNILKLFKLYTDNIKLSREKTEGVKKSER